MKKQEQINNEQWESFKREGIISISGYLSEFGRIFFKIQRTEKDKTLGFFKEGIVLFETRNGFTKVLKIIESGFKVIVSYGWNPRYELEYKRIESIFIDRVVNDNPFNDEDFGLYMDYFSLHFSRQYLM